MSDQPLIFVVGAGRSGTSLLQSMLAMHSEIAFLPETGFFRRYVTTRRIERIAAKRGRKAVEELLARDRRLSRTGIAAQEILEGIGSRSGLTGAELYKSMLRRYAEVRGKRIVGDKDPRSIELLGLLHREHPEGHVIHVIRDPRDVLASKKKAQWSRRYHWLRHVFANRTHVQMGRSDGLRLFGGRYHEVIYESLIQDPVGVLSELCRRLGIQFEEDMLDFSRAARRLVAPEELQWKAETLGALQPQNAQKWRKDLGSFETAMTERACWIAMEAGGYDYSGAAEHFGLLRRLILYCGLAALAISSRIYVASRRIYFGVPQSDGDQWANSIRR